MKKIFLYFLFMLLSILPICLPQTNLAEGEAPISYIVTANEAVVFSEASLTSSHLFTLKHKDEIQLEMEETSPKRYAGDGFIFFHIINEEKEGFILSDLVVPKNNFLTTIPKFNAKTNAKARVYFLQNGNYTPSNITLPKHQRVFLYQGFNNKKQYNAVAFVHENEVVYGFLKKDDIDPDGVNPLLITIACFAIAAIGIILTFVFMKRKKKKTGVSKIKNR